MKDIESDSNSQLLVIQESVSSASLSKLAAEAQVSVNMSNFAVLAISFPRHPRILRIGIKPFVKVLQIFPCEELGFCGMNPDFHQSHRQETFCGGLVEFLWGAANCLNEVSHSALYAQLSKSNDALLRYRYCRILQYLYYGFYGTKSIQNQPYNR